MERTQQIRYFLFGQHLADGFRITLEIILPPVILSYFGHLETGMVMALGAMAVSISDGPGPVAHKRNGMLYCNVFVFVMAILTGLMSTHLVLLGILILTATFFFSMFSIYGARAGSVGTAALLIMILRMSMQVPTEQVLTDALLILAGGVWYMLFALLFYRLTPFRPAQRALGNCIVETADYLLIKAEIYDPATNLEKEYRQLLDQQVKVNEAQNTTRELLFKSRAILKESTRQGRILVLTFADVVDMFEHIMATWYDYRYLREKYKDTGILEEVKRIVIDLSIEMKSIGEAIHSDQPYKKQYELLPALEQLKEKIDSITDLGSTLMLKKILVNIRNLGEKLDELLRYFEVGAIGKESMRSSKDYARFVSHQKISAAVLRNNLTLSSSAFRHSLRVMITCGVGFLIAKLISTGHHSYWILMTIIIILKPAFSLTREKNFDRLTGTIAGGIVGIALLGFVHDRTVLISLMFFFMVATYTFVRLNYVVMVIFLTPYVLILFHILGLSVVDVAGERLADTAIASLLAFLASHFLFPHWESSNLNRHMAAVLKANIQYLRKLKTLFYGSTISSLDYKLVRKDLFIATANLSAALHRMLSEPKNKQHRRQQIYEFVVLNHVLSSNIASLTATMYDGRHAASKEGLAKIRRCIEILQKSLEQLEPGQAQNEPFTHQLLLAAETSPDPQLAEQLNFIYKVTGDIGKLTSLITVDGLAKAG